LVKTFGLTLVSSRCFPFWKKKILKNFFKILHKQDNVLSKLTNCIFATISFIYGCPRRAHDILAFVIDFVGPD